MSCVRSRDLVHTGHQPDLLTRPPGWFTAFSSLWRFESCGLCCVYLKPEVCPGGHIFSIGLSRTPFGTHLQPQTGEYPPEMRLPGPHVWRNSRPALWHHHFQGSSTLQRCWEAWKQQVCSEPCWGNPFMQTYLLFSSLRIDAELLSPPSWIPFPSFHGKCQDTSNPHECLFLLFWLLGDIWKFINKFPGPASFYVGSISFFP